MAPFHLCPTYSWLPGTVSSLVLWRWLGPQGMDGVLPGPKWLEPGPHRHPEQIPSSRAGIPTPTLSVSPGADSLALRQGPQSFELQLLAEELPSSSGPQVSLGRIKENLVFRMVNVGHI